MLFYLLGFALVLPALGGGEVLARAAHDFRPPRVSALRRTSLLTVAFALITVAIGTFVFVRLVPSGEQSLWGNAPLVGLARHLDTPWWAQELTVLALAVAEQMLRRLSDEGSLPEALGALHAKLGTPTRILSVTAGSTVLLILLSEGRVSWLARAYAIAIAFTLALKVAALIRFRLTRPGQRP